MSAIEGLAYLHAQGMKQPQSTKIENLTSILSLETIHTGGIYAVYDIITK